MFFFPKGENAGTTSKAALEPINILIGYRLQNDAAKLVFEEFDSGPGLNAMFTAKLRRDDELAFGGECSTSFIHVLQV